MKKIFNKNELQNIIKNIAEKYDYIYECWDGGKQNIDCCILHNDIYKVRIKSFDTSKFEIIKEDLNKELASYKFYIFDEKDAKQNRQPIREFFISNKRGVKFFNKENKVNNKQKTIIKNSMIGCQNCEMDNSKDINISPTINFKN